MRDRARESNLWEWFAKARITFGERLHMQRIENSLDRGTPDVHGCLDGMGFVIELKSVPRPQIDIIYCELSVDQAMFLRARRRAGGAAYVLVQVGTYSEAKLYLVPGEYSDKLLDVIPEKLLRTFSVIPENCNAFEIIQKICQRN